MPPNSSPPLTDASKRVAHRLLAIFENRSQLLVVELQEERERIVRAFLLGIGVLAFGVLAGGALTALILVALWGHSPVITLSVLTALYLVSAVFFYLRLAQLQRKWQTFNESMAQFRKDCECLEKNFN